MKSVNIVIGLLFGAWAIGTLFLGIRDLQAPLDSLAEMISLSASGCAFVMLALVSFWSFQSAFQKPLAQDVAH